MLKAAQATFLLTSLDASAQILKLILQQLDLSSIGLTLWDYRSQLPSKELLDILGLRRFVLGILDSLVIVEKRDKFAWREPRVFQSNFHLYSIHCFFDVRELVCHNPEQLRKFFIAFTLDYLLVDSLI